MGGEIEVSTIAYIHTPAVGIANSHRHTVCFPGGQGGAYIQGFAGF